MLEDKEGAIRHGQFRATGNTRYTRREKTMQKHNTICVGHHHAKTNNVRVSILPLSVIFIFDFQFWILVWPTHLVFDCNQIRSQDALITRWSGVEKHDYQTTGGNNRIHLLTQFNTCIIHGIYILM